MSIWGDITGAIEATGHTVDGLLHPGGDPDAIHAAAAATRTLASRVQSTMAQMNSVAAGMESYWRGLGPGQDTSAASAYQAAWGKFSKSVHTFTGELGKAATQIDDAGNAVSQAQSEARKLWITLDASLAVGFIVGLLTAEADELAIAETDIAVAAGTMTTIEGFLADAAIMLSALVQALPAVAAQFALGFFADGAAVVFGKWRQDLDPWNPDSYDADDLNAAVLGGGTAMLLGWAGGIPKIAALTQDHPFLEEAAWHAAETFVEAVPWDFWIQHDSLTSGKTWLGILESTGVSAVSGPALLLGGKVPGLSALFREGEMMPGVTWEDVTHNALNIPIGGEQLDLFTGLPSSSIPSVPGAGTRPGPAPGVPVLALPQVPAHIGGGTYTVQQGDTLYGIAAKRLGNPNLYPALQAANPSKVSPDGWVDAGTTLNIPVLSPPESQSGAAINPPHQ